MTGVHLYCIVPEGHPVPEGCVGLDGAAPTVAPAGDGLALWVGAAAAPRAASIEDARVHDAVVRAAMTAAVTPVPVRFGQWFASAEDAAARVAEHAARWRGQLEHFAGRAEWGVRARVEGNAAREMHPRTESGTAYMLELARKQAEDAAMRADGERLAADIRKRAGSAVADWRVDTAAPAGTVLAMALLMPWDGAAALDAAVQAVRSERPDLHVIRTGPWPPYSFVA